MENSNNPPKKTNDRYKLVDGIELCFCSGHYDYLPCSEFQRNRGFAHGYNYSCIQCQENGVKSKWGPTIKKEENEKLLVNQFLENLGYDLHSPKPVHQQFSEKYNL